MASNINSHNIDTSFPVPGQDNDTQGFRDNFTAIANALTTASSEITVLQSNTAKLNADNNFNGSIIQNATFKNVGYSVQSNGSISGAVEINYPQGNYQTVTVDPLEPTVITVINWPTTGIWSSIRLQVKASAVGEGTASVQFNTQQIGGQTIHVDSMITNPIIIQTTSTYLFEISSPDHGATQFLTTVGSGQFN
jgi:hypothetical protein